MAVIISVAEHAVLERSTTHETRLAHVIPERFAKTFTSKRAGQEKFRRVYFIRDSNTLFIAFPFGRNSGKLIAIQLSSVIKI